MAIDPAYWTWVNTEWNAGRLTRPGTALQQLQANPRAFLTKYPILNMYDPQADGVGRPYLLNGEVGHRPGSILKTKNMHTTESFKIQPAPGRLGEGHPFWVHGLSTGQSNVAPVWLRLDNNGPDLMLTAKLTGCTFVARPVVGFPGQVDVTHLQANGEDGLALNTRLDIAGQKAYGRLKYDYTDRSINVIGVRRTGIWKIYAQKIEKHSMTVRSVTRIFPL